MSTSKVSIDQYKVTATGFFSLFSIVGIMFYGLPFFFDFWVKDFGWTRAQVTSGNVIGKVIVGPLLGFFAGWFIDKFGPKKLMIFGVLTAGLAVMGFSNMSTLWHFYLLYFAVAIGYMCGGPLPNQVLISRWFTTARGKAMGIAYLGIGFGGMLVPHIARSLNVNFGWQSSLVALGIIMIAVGLPFALMVKEQPNSENNVANNSNEPKPSIKEILKSKSFYLLAIGSMCSIGAVAGISQNLKLFLSLDMKYTQGQAATIMSLVLGASIIGRLLMGYLADKYSKKYVMILIYCIITCAILLLNYLPSSQMIYIFAVLFGIGLGGDYMIIPLMAAELFGVKIMGRVMGLILTVDGIAEAVGPVMAGKLRDTTGSYSTGFTALIALSILGTIAIAMLSSSKNK
jgi:sugar phosphate permease